MTFEDHSKEVISDLQKAIRAGVTEATLMVETSIIEKAPADNGQLRNSITHNVSGTVDSVKGVVGSPLDYAVYQEYGTGEHATNGAGRKGFWIYIAGNGASSGMFGKGKGKSYTLAEAKKAKAIMLGMNSSLKPSDIHITNGVKATKFFSQGFKTKKNKIIDVINKHVQGV